MPMLPSIDGYALHLDDDVASVCIPSFSSTWVHDKYRRYICVVRKDGSIDFKGMCLDYYEAGTVMPVAKNIIRVSPDGKTLVCRLTERLCISSRLKDGRAFVAMFRLV